MGRQAPGDAGRGSLVKMSSCDAKTEEAKRVGLRSTSGLKDFARPAGNQI